MFRKLFRSSRTGTDKGSGLVGRLGIADLTRDAGIATGSFYNHFGGEDELFDAVIAEVIEALVRILDTAAAGIDDPTGVVRAHLRALGEVGIGHPDIAVIVGCFRTHDLGAALDLVGESSWQFCERRSVIRRR
ncbi:TetR/AcrR family transcriptional regulator [Nocardia exalbida]|uniref:TetR/AcrR family transcriptional regulator n=1 Tax=Nocardia exalbida TaxID=290231 RepID=UPI0002F102F6|nr:TetR/AcrR family transcriptional regulator [Nocardia exalbida]